jgi:hypothetical protein
MTFASARSLFLAATFAVASAGLSFAQTPQATTRSNQACPVELSQLRIHDNKLIFRDRNSSDMYIKKIAFGAAYLDSANVPHRIEVQGGWKDLHAGYVLDSALDIKNYRKTDYTGWAIWPEKVLFSDGSMWQIDQATGSCGLETSKSNKEDVAYVPLQILNGAPVRGEN